MTGFELAAGERLLHIGPFKTGSTALQSAMHLNRELLAAEGIHYAGKNAQPMAAAMVASTGETLPSSGKAALSAWDRLIEEIDETDLPRVMVSSEFFCEADPQRIENILRALGHERTHVVLTLRPLSRIIASQWQQYIQNAVTTSYEEFLHDLLDPAVEANDRSLISTVFWMRHRHHEVARRWVEVAGPERVHLVVVDESRPSMLLRTFENFLGLEQGALSTDPGAANRSLTFPEAELVREFNKVWEHRGWSEADYTRLVRFGAVRRLQERTPAPSEQRILTPQWACKQVLAVADEIADDLGHLKAQGVSVVGEVDSLRQRFSEASVGDNEPCAHIDAAVAGRFIAGLVHSLETVPEAKRSRARSLGRLESTMRSRLDLEEVMAKQRRVRTKLARAHRA